MGLPETILSRQPGEALSTIQTTGSQSGTDRLKNLKEVKVNLRRKETKPFRWSSERRPIPVPSCEGDGVGYVFTKKMLVLARFGKIYANGPNDPLKSEHFFS